MTLATPRGGPKGTSFGESKKLVSVVGISALIKRNRQERTLLFCWVGESARKAKSRILLRRRYVLHWAWILRSTFQVEGGGAANAIPTSRRGNCHSHGCALAAISHHTLPRATLISPADAVTLLPEPPFTAGRGGCAAVRRAAETMKLRNGAR